MCHCLCVSWSFPVICHSDSLCVLPLLEGTNPLELMSPGYLKSQLPDEFKKGYDFIVQIFLIVKVGVRLYFTDFYIPSRSGSLFMGFKIALVQG